jgi:hypothetical protein
MKILLCKVARAPVLQTSKKEPVYVAKACAVCIVSGTSLRWPGPESCFQPAPQGGAESDFAGLIDRLVILYSFITSLPDRRESMSTTRDSDRNVQFA